MMDTVRWIEFQDNPDERGRLTAVEADRHVPFPIARVFLVHQVAPGTDRGGHAHRDTDQVLACTHGRLKVDVSDGRGTLTFVLDDPARGLFVPRMLWIRLYDFEQEAVLLVYANTHYDRSQSIRTWDEYLAAVGATGQPRPGFLDGKGSLRSRDGRTWQEVRSGDSALLVSALTDRSLHTLEEFHDWFESRRAAAHFKVERRPLAQLRGWTIDPGTGNVGHQSGRFFRVIGVDVQTNFGPTPRWTQPIIHQDEIGILGFLAQKKNGVLHFLLQAKMEPGNINLLQISPTVQATRSNLTQVHGGKRPPYIDFFLNCNRDNVVYDRLQSEQGSRFLCKRNRNMIVAVPDPVDVPVYDDFIWVTLAQIYELLSAQNLINMDSRTVLSGICHPLPWKGSSGLLAGQPMTRFQEDLLRSISASDDGSTQGGSQAIYWLTAMRARYDLNVHMVPLKDVQEWGNDGDTIHHCTGRFFSVIGVTVSASTREVVDWDQPLIQSAKGGIVCFFCQKINGVLHFLVQARVEPGSLDCVDVGPTLQFTPINYEAPLTRVLPPFTDLFRSLRPDQIRYDSLQSEEGGRFYQDQNRYLVAETDPGQIQEIPENYFWMTLWQIKQLLRYSNCLHIEARSLLACIGLHGR